MNRPLAPWEGSLDVTISRMLMSYAHEYAWPGFNKVFVYRVQQHLRSPVLVLTTFLWDRNRIICFSQSLVYYFNLYAELQCLPLVVDGRVLVPEELCNKKVNQDTPLAMLLPSDQGMGGCALALVHFLCAQQNEFLELYARISGQR